MADPAHRRAVWPLLAAVVGIALTAALGAWQLGRAHEKRELKERADTLAKEPPVHVGAAEIAAQGIEMRRVEARGEFDTRYAIYLDNRLHRGVPGYDVVTPLRIEGSARHVLVDRGWIAARPLRSELPPVTTPGGVLTVSGRAVVPGRRIFELSDRVIEGAVWQNLTIERYRSARPLDIQPFVILQESAADDGLVREWPAQDFGIDRHYGYAFQWFALSATILVFYAVARYRRRRESAPA